MKRFINISFFIFISFYFNSCSKKTKTKSFYLKKLFSKKELLTFISKTNNKLQFWEVSRNDNGIIITKRRNSKNEFIDETIEKITEKGSNLISYKFIESSGEFPFEIEFFPKRKELIKWDLAKSSIYTGEYINNGIIFQVKRKRQFFKKEKQILIFKDSFESKPIKGQLSNKKEELYKTTFSQISYFEKNKGLVKYQKNYPNGKSEIFELQKTKQ